MASKAVIHCDVDCFYCQVEVLDNPALAGAPLAVHQGNSGGFVAVNYQARAAGIRCGDGSDPHNLAARTFQHEKNRSRQEAQQLCPGLVTKPMRSDRYRQVSAQILALITQHAANGQCEKTSYDDFYLEVSAGPSMLSSAAVWVPPADTGLHILGGGSFDALPAMLKWAVQVACNIRAAVQREMALTMSFGIAVGKLAARLAGPLHKPSGMTVVPPHRAPAFLLDTPILKVPHLRGQVGKQVVEQLSVERVRDLAVFEAKEFTALFGTATGQLLFDLGHCIDDKRVQAKGPQQSICCTKSYHGLRDFARVDEALQRLVFALWPRLLEERSISGRMPAKLKVACKQGGREQQVRSYTLPFPHAATQQLQATALGSVDPSASQSSAVHTLIPNLAPRSRLQHPGLMLRHQPQPLCNEGSADWETQRPGSACLPLQDHLLVDRSHEDAQAGEGGEHSGQAGIGDRRTSAVKTSSVEAGNVDAAERHADKACVAAADSQPPASGNGEAQPLSSHESVQGWLESGPHQAARNAIFQAAMGQLKPKLLQPILVNFMSVAGEYGKESGPQPRSGQGGMLRFLQHGASSGLSADAVAGSHLPVCNTDSIEAQFAKGRLQHHAADLPNDQASQALLDIKLPPGRVADHTRKRTRHQHPTTLSQSHAKLLKQGAGPMDRLLLKDHSRP